MTVGVGNTGFPLESLGYSLDDRYTLGNALIDWGQNVLKGKHFTHTLKSMVELSDGKDHEVTIELPRLENA